MATAVVMPKLGNTVESSILVNWIKHKGDRVAQGEPLFEIETDKAAQEVESPASGILLELFFQAGDDVPVMTTIAAIGEPGEDVSALRPGLAPASAPVAAGQDGKAVVADAPSAPVVTPTNARVGISPRARNLAGRKNLDVVGIQGTGPGGRIIERDIEATLESRQKVTPLARAMLDKGDYVAPSQGTGFGGRITSRDLQAAVPAVPAVPAVALVVPPAGDDVQVIPLKGVRKIIAARMLNSVQTTAQLTMNASADARALQDYRKRLKASPEALGLQKVTINDLVLFIVSRTLLQYPELNALFFDEAVHQYTNVHLAMAVDTPRGLIVPVIRHADALSLRQIAQESKRLSDACLNGTVSPDELNGGTFTVTNLGSLGIESFTPVLNPPQVGILGVGNINLKPVEVNGDVAFIPHLGLSLTINHQVVDGAPAARFLQALSQNLAQLELVLAL